MTPAFDKDALSSRTAVLARRSRRWICIGAPGCRMLGQAPPGVTRSRPQQGTDPRLWDAGAAHQDQFAGCGMSASGPSRRLVRLRQFERFWSRADMYLLVLLQDLPRNE